MILLMTSLVQAEVTNSGRIQEYEVDIEAMKKGPAKNISSQNLCDGDQSFSVYADLGRQTVPTCEMYLNPFFAQMIKNFVPQCAKKAARENGIDIPTHVSVDHLGGYVDRNARNSSKKSRHSLGMALDLSMVRLHYKKMNGSETTKQIPLIQGTSNQAFYDSFRSCWDKAAKVTTAALGFVSGQDCSCSIGHSDTHKPSNHLHDDHMHISLACPRGNAVQCASEQTNPMVAKVTE